MDIVAGIAAATEALKLTRERRSIDRELDKAELKLRLIELTDRLLEAKEALQDAKEERRSFEERIKKLETDLQFRGQLADRGGRLYKLNEDGKPAGEPYCNLCYVKEAKLYRLLYVDGGEYVHALLLRQL